MLDNIKPTVIALGYFDSVHLGHQKLINLARSYADEMGYSLTIFSFKGNLKKKLGKDDKCIYLAKEREEFLKNLGADQIYFAPTSKSFLSKGKRAFLNELNKKLNIKCYFSGEDYSFGAFGQGDVKYLKEYSKSHGQDYVVVDMLKYFDEKISSSKIKEQLKNGNIKIANHLLGREYSILGKVISDRHIGTKLGFPTANIKIDKDKFMLKTGVYAGKVSIKNKEHFAIINYGSRPTFDLEQNLIETHIVDFSGNLYGKNIKISFLGYIRDIKKFQSEEMLKDQLKKDINCVKEGKYD